MKRQTNLPPEKMQAPDPVTGAIVLAGGRGARLGPLTADMPKPLLPVGGPPFLHYLIFNLARQGVTNLLLSVGYQGQKIKDALGDGNALGVSVRYAEEETPLGTGGAIKLAARHFEHPFFVLNGDTLFDCPLQRLVFVLHSAKAQAALFLRAVDDAGRYGAVGLDGSEGGGTDAWGRIRSFGEKSATGPGLINGGVYLLTPDFSRHIPHGACSLEKDVLPDLAARGCLAGLPGSGFFLDMGLPESYAAAQTLLPAWRISVRHSARSGK